MDGDTFEVVDEFVYLSTLVTYDNEVSREVKRRIAAANKAYYSLRSQFWSRSLRIRMKFTLYRTLILPMALHGQDS